MKEHCISSDGILDLDEWPKRLAVIGGGYIGIEFAGMFNNLGTKTDIFIRGDKVLRGFDEEVCACSCYVMRIMWNRIMWNHIVRADSCQ